MGNDPGKILTLYFCRAWLRGPLGCDNGDGMVRLRLTMTSIETVDSPAEYENSRLFRSVPDN
jgi:hypothetical protein